MSPLPVGKNLVAEDTDGFSPLHGVEGKMISAVCRTVPKFDQENSKKHYHRIKPAERIPKIFEEDGDVSAGQGKNISVSEKGIVPRFCLMMPGALLFGLMILQTIFAFCLQELFLVTTGILTVYVFSWTVNLSIFSLVGAFRMRRDARLNWQKKSEEALASLSGVQDEVIHILIVPNYLENEEMLLQTLMNVASSPCAASSIHVVLGMEAREGENGRVKADHLIAGTRHLFKDVFATYHPTKYFPGELAGKSSNTQYAYRMALQRYAGILSHKNPNRVIISVGDADTLWNPQYFDALSYDAYTLDAEELSWTIWQPPMLLFRNLESVPGVTRLSGYGTLLYELSGVSNQRFGTHMCFSSYSLPLALANHRKIRGWDTDVIAEDHHMFTKCFFASLWDQVESKDANSVNSRPVVGQLQLKPIYLPAEGYLVESNGYWSSIWSRFQQALRHSQGIAELSYAGLQYIRILQHGKRGAAKLSWRAHAQVWSLMWKMTMVHIINNVQACSLLTAALLTGTAIFKSVLSLGIRDGLHYLFEQGILNVGAAQMSAKDFAKFGLGLIFQPAVPVGIMSAACIYVVISDVANDRYRKCSENNDSGLSRWQSLRLLVRTQTDMLLFAEPTIILYGLVPATVAAMSMFKGKSDFEYVVADKPL